MYSKNVNNKKLHIYIFKVIFWYWYKEFVCIFFATLFSAGPPEVFQSDCFDKLFQKTKNISVLRKADTQTPLCGFMSEVKHDLW